MRGKKAQFSLWLKVTDSERDKMRTNCIIWVRQECFLLLTTPHNFQNLSSLTRVWTKATAWKALNPRHQATRELPKNFYIKMFSLFWAPILWGFLFIFCSMLYVAAAAAAKSLQLCSTLWDPIDGSPPGSPIPGILQARTLEWVAISSSNAWQWKVTVKSLSRVRLLATPWIAAHQAPPSMGFSRQEYWSGWSLPSPMLYVILLKI